MAYDDQVTQERGRVSVARRRSALVGVLLVVLLTGCVTQEEPGLMPADESSAALSSAASSSAQSDAGEPGSADETSDAGDSTAPEPSPVPSDLPTDEATIETSDGATVSTSGELPDDFPAERVPLVAGKILSVTSAAGVFNVSLLAPRKPRRAIAQAAELLRNKGYQVEEQRMSTGLMLRGQGLGYRVEVAATPAGQGQSSLVYFVTKR